MKKELQDLKTGDKLYSMRYGNIQGEFYFDIQVNTIQKITPKKIFLNSLDYSGWGDKFYEKENRPVMKNKLDLKSVSETGEELFEALKGMVERSENSDNLTNNAKKNIRKAYDKFLNKKKTILKRLNNYK